MLEELKSEEARQLIPKIYEDLLQPGVRKVGVALETVFGLSSTIVLPIRLVNEKASLLFQKHMDNYREKLNQVPNENITDVPSEIGLPILERLTYTTNQEIADLLTTLLTKASDDRTANQAHPGFVQILQRLSVDEARIIKYLGTGTPKNFILDVEVYYDETRLNKVSVPIDVIHYTRLISHHGYRYSIQVHELFLKTDLHYNVELLFSENISAYLDNLTSMGILRSATIGERMNIYHKDIINHIQEKAYQKEWSKQMFDTIMSNEDNIVYSRYYLTDYGILFVAACNPTQK